MAFRTIAAMLALALPVPASASRAEDATAAAPTLAIVSPYAGATLALGDDAGRSVAVEIAVGNFTIRPAGRCAGLPQCGHVHLAIDYPGTTCNAPGSGGNSTNAGAGGTVVQAHFGYCPSPAGRHVIAVALARDDHSLVLVDGKPVTAVVAVTTR
ncbi:MAG: hypothetical protein ACLQJR_17195 [Stellaceae bacterium]